MSRELRHDTSAAWLGKKRPVKIRDEYGESRDKTFKRMNDVQAFGSSTLPRSRTRAENRRM